VHRERARDPRGLTAVGASLGCVAPAPVHRLISASDLKRQRAWTETLVSALLGAPDAHGPNPHGFRAPMRFFREDRVLAAELEAPFARRLEHLSTHQAWRRDQPTRSLAPTEIPHLEWLDDPWRIALFHAPRRPGRRRRRPSVPAPSSPATMRFEVLRLFQP
jgi:hypothetical protein